MLFSSVPFLFYFLPAALLIYFAAPRQLKNAVLLLASLFFYAWGEPKYMLLMLVSIVQGYGFGLLIEKHRGQKASKVFLTLSILVSLGLLGYFKYADFFLSSVNAVTGLSLPLLKLSLPIGISFYTFQVLSYVIDVYRGETAAQRNFIDLAAYVSLFPQLIAGPIVRYSDVAAELKSRTHSVSAAAEGVRRPALLLACTAAGQWLTTANPRDGYDPQYSLYALWDPADFLADGQPAAWVTMYATE